MASQDSQTPEFFKKQLRKITVSPAGKHAIFHRMGTRDFEQTLANAVLLRLNAICVLLRGVAFEKLAYHIYSTKTY